MASRHNVEMACRILTVAAYKGGVGKTTLALELANVLDAVLVDLEWEDGSATRRWGYRHERYARRPLMDALQSGQAPKPLAGRRKADLVPGHRDMATASLGADEVADALEQWAGEWDRDWIVVDTHPGANPFLGGAMAAASVIAVPTPLKTTELDGLEGMLTEAADFPLLLVPNMVPSRPPASLNRRLWEMAQKWDVPLGPVVSEYRELPRRQQRMAVTALDPTPISWQRYVDEIQAVARAVKDYGHD
jgi:chromosome partitioning protein